MYFLVSPQEELISSVIDEDAVLTLSQDAFPKGSNFTRKFYNAKAYARSVFERAKPTFHQYYLLHDWQGRTTDQWINDTKAAVLKHPSSAILRFGWGKEAAREYFAAAKVAQEKVGTLVQIFNGINANFVMGLQVIA